MFEGIILMALFWILLYWIFSKNSKNLGTQTTVDTRECPPHAWRPRNDTTHSYICIKCNRTPSDPSLDA